MWARARVRFATSDLLLAGALAALFYRWALVVRPWSDFFWEEAPSVRHLLGGDLAGFLARAPTYGGSLILRAPAMALGGALGGLDGADIGGALLCLGALIVLALALAGHLRRAGRPAWTAWLTLTVVLLNPVAAWGFMYGHGEEVLTAVLCVAGVLLAGRGRVTLAGVMLGVAGASKQWGLLAIPLALAVAPERRLRMGLTVIAAYGLTLAPLILSNAGAFVSSNQAAASAPTVFHADQIWRTLGMYYMRPLGGPHSKILGATPTAFVANYSHPLIVLSACALGLLWWLRRRRLEPTDALLMLALILLIRCALDPWNNVYYQTPFVLALAAWEVYGRRRAPLLAAAASLLVWYGFRWVDIDHSALMSNLFYVGWTVPAAALMAGTSLRLKIARLGGDRVATGARNRPQLPAASI